MCEFISWCELEPSAQAAWVQAVGSVLAILVAVAIPAIGAWFKSKADQRARHERMLNAALQIYDPLSSLQVSLDEFYETNSPDYDPENPLVSIDPNSGDFQALMPTMIASISSLKDMGHLAPALRKFLFNLIELDRFLKMIPAVQRTGSPAYWINNIDEILNMVKETKNNADVVLKQIKDTISASN